MPPPELLLSGSEAASELEQFAALNARDLIAGEIWYVINCAWFKAWKSFNKGKTETPPGTIDNTALIETINPEEFMINPGDSSTPRILHPDLTQNKDYMVIS